jgi:hypothetical protein
MVRVTVKIQWLTVICIYLRVRVRTNSQMFSEKWHNTRSGPARGPDPTFSTSMHTAATAAAGSSSSSSPQNTNEQITVNF